MTTPLLAVLLVGLAAASSAPADTTQLGAARDTTLYESPHGLLANGAGEYFFAGKTKDGELRRGLIAFDIAGAIPADASIVSVTLTLVMTKSMSGERPVSLHRVLAPWGEGGSDAAGEEGQGAPAEPGDATWLHAFFDDTPWMSKGGDYAQTASAALLVGDEGSYTWASTPEMVADAQSWLDSPQTNFGWCLVGGENEVFTAKRFDSRENADEAKRPVLIVEFTPACWADCDQTTGKGVLDLFDCLCFQNAFISGDPWADCTGNGEFEVADFVCFMDLFAAGCP